METITLLESIVDSAELSMSDQILLIHLIYQLRDKEKDRDHCAKLVQILQSDDKVVSHTG